MARVFEAAIANVDGSAGSPAFTFESNQNTGMYRSNTNVIGFAVAGVARATLSATGLNVAGEVYAQDSVTAEDEVSHRHGTSRQTSMMDLEVLSWM